MCDQRRASDVFYVMKGNCGCLLKESQTLGFIKVADHVVHNVGSTECPELKKYLKLFDGIGKFKNLTIISMRPFPLYQRHRRIPFHQCQNVKGTT